MVYSSNEDSDFPITECYLCLAAVGVSLLFRYYSQGRWGSSLIGATVAVGQFAFMNYSASKDHFFTQVLRSCAPPPPMHSEARLLEQKSAKFVDEGCPILTTWTSRCRPVNSLSEVRILTPTHLTLRIVLSRTRNIHSPVRISRVVLSRTRNTHSPVCNSRVVLSRTRDSHSSVCIYRVSNDIHGSTTTRTLRWTGSVMYDNDLVMNAGVDNDSWIH